jgi:ribosomal protein S12 methylthiotransferase
VPEALKDERRARFMEVQAAISSRRLARRVGRAITVLVDEVGEEGAVARSAADAPEIDGLVYVDDGFGLQPGEFARVKVTRAAEHDLHASLVA